MKLKHQFFILCTIVISAMLFIGIAHAFEGPYISGSFGGILSPVNHLGDKFTEIAAQTGGLKIDESWKTARKPSINFSIHGGFGKLHNNHYSGVELSANKSRYRMKISKSSGTQNLNTQDDLNLNLREVDYSVDYKHGYLLSNKTMVFAKAGLSRTRARLTLLSESTIKVGDVEATYPTYIKNEKSIHPMRVGFGVEHKFRDDLSVICDYTYTRYMRRFKLNGNTKTETPFGDLCVQHNHRITIQDTSITVGLKKYF